MSRLTFNGADEPPIPKRAVGQVWKMKDDKPGVFLIVAPGNTSYSDDAWTVLVLESRRDEDRVRVFDDVWFSLGWAELVY